MLWIVFHHQAVKNVYIHYTVHTESILVKNPFLLLPTLTQPNPPFPFSFSSNFPFLSFFLSFLLIFHYTSLPSPPLPPTLPYPPPSLKSLPTLPCPALSRLSGIITCTQKKKKNKSQKTKKEKDYLSLQSVKSSIYHITITITHLFSGEREGRGGGEGERGTTVPTGTRPQRLW